MTAGCPPAAYATKRINVDEQRRIAGASQREFGIDDQPPIRRNRGRPCSYFMALKTMAFRPMSRSTMATTRHPPESPGRMGEAIEHLDIAAGLSHSPDGNVSATSPAFHNAFRSNGSTARVSSKCSRKSNCSGNRAWK